LPSIKPISPLSAEVTAQANVRAAEEGKAATKIGRQLSVASHGNHYPDVHRQEAERALNGQSEVISPVGQKEGFFSHLRKRARRLSGRYQTPMSPNSDDIEANAGCAPWATNSARHSLTMEQAQAAGTSSTSDFSELDKALQHVRDSVEAHSQQTASTKTARVATNPMLKRHHSVPHGPEPRNSENGGNAPISSRTRRAVQNKSNPSNRYETPNEEEELLSEVLASTHSAATKLDAPTASYLTPSSSANRNSIGFGQSDYMTPSKPMEITKAPNKNEETVPNWPTPPDDWASSVAASLMAAQTRHR
jgi:meiosis induction protein kinase IME2/SME1